MSENTNTNPNPTLNNSDIDDDDIEQATHLAYFLAEMSGEDEPEDIIADLRKRRINPMKLIERYDRAQEAMGDLSNDEMRLMWGNKPAASRPARRKAVKVKN